MSRHRIHHGLKACSASLRCIAGLLASTARTGLGLGRGAGAG
ncbi:hypothetical protein ACLBKT_07565 [Erythrobacter sp. W302b]